MSGRILVVDDLEPNRRLLEARLQDEYYDVLLANDGEEALAIAAAEKPDLILLDVMMPGIDGFETCRRLKADPELFHIPVVLVTALDEQEDRVNGLEAGAEDFITKPIDNVVLLARVRSLLRLKVVLDELRMRERLGRSMGAIRPGDNGEDIAKGAEILVVDDPGRSAERLAERLGKDHNATLTNDPDSAPVIAQGSWDVILLNLAAETFDGMRLAARLRSEEGTRNVPILGIVDPDEKMAMLRALDIGVNDILNLPVEPAELAARVRTQVKRRRYADFLRTSLDQSLELSVTDQLTGLHNRRYMTSQLREMSSAAQGDKGSLAVFLADIDHFKKVNDTYGHDAGDMILREFASRLRGTARAVDIACRYGGEEFVVLMPQADLEAARIAAERLRTAVGDAPFRLPNGESQSVTVSIGVALFEAGDTPDVVLKRADEALYAAKSGGRNLVMVSRLKRAA